MLSQTIYYRNANNPNNVNIREGFLTHRKLVMESNDYELIEGLMNDRIADGYKVISNLLVDHTTGLNSVTVEGEYELLPNGRATNKIQKLS